MASETGSRQAATCRNCDASLHGEFCHRCGQADHDLDIRFSTLAKEWMGSVFGLDAKLWRTLRLLARYPGELTRRYLDGHRAAYVSPLRLYLIASLLLFLVFSWTGSSIVVNGQGGGESSVIRITTTPSTESDADAEDAADDGEATTETPTAGDEDGAESATANDTEPDSELETTVEAFLDRAGKNLSENRRSFDRTFREQAGRAIILLVPAFALLLKLFFFGSRRPYLHHLVFSLHIHAMVFFTVACFATLRHFIGTEYGEPIAKLAHLALMIYLGVALRRFFGESRWRTALKTFFLLISHLVVLSMVVIGAFAATLLLLD